MKKILLLPLSLVLIEIGHAQTLKKKINTSLPEENSNTKTTQVKSTDNRTIVKVPVKPNNILPLNSHNSEYHKYISKLNTNLPSSVTQKLINLIKIYTYPDGTKIKVNMVNKANHPSLSDDNQVKPAVKGTTNSTDGAFDCTSTHVTLSSSSTTFMNNNFTSSVPYIYPGAIYNYDDLQNGNFKEQSTGRNRVIITTDNSNISGDSYEIVDQPNQVNLTNAVTKLFQRFSSAPAAIKTFPYQVYEASNSADLNMKLGVDASGYGASFGGQYEHSTDQQTEYLTIDAYKTLFSISVAIPDSGYFKNKPGWDSHLVVVGTVNYGVRVLANLKATFKSQKDEVDFNAAYNSFLAKVNVDFNYFSSNKSTENTINAYYVGGPSSFTTISFDKSQLENQIQQYFMNANYQNAVPISYELFDMNNNQMGTISSTDEFQIPLCVPKDMSGAALNCSGSAGEPNSSYAYVKTGNNSDDNKDPDTHWSLGVFDANGNSVASFHDDSNNDPYSDGSTHSPLYLTAQKSATFGDFINGGRIHINIAPNGHDTWNMDEFTVFLKFNNPAITQKLTWTGISVNEGSRDIDLKFHYDQNSNTLVADAY